MWETSTFQTFLLLFNSNSNIDENIFSTSRSINLQVFRDNDPEKHIFTRCLSVLAHVCLFVPLKMYKVMHTKLHFLYYLRLWTAGHTQPKLGIFSIKGRCKRFLCYFQLYHRKVIKVRARIEQTFFTVERKWIHYASANKLIFYKVKCFYNDPYFHSETPMHYETVRVENGDILLKRGPNSDFMWFSQIFS